MTTNVLILVVFDFKNINEYRSLFENKN